MIERKNNKRQKLREKISVFTAIEDFRLPKGFKKRVQIFPFQNLSEMHREWICENALRLMSHSTKAEQSFEQKLIQNNIQYEKQAFFRIDKSDYFLDFYFPQIKVAVEIDGSVHRKQRQYDRLRDSNFRKIGIRTIRINNSEAYNENVLQIVEQRYFSKYSTVRR